MNPPGPSIFWNTTELGTLNLFCYVTCMNSSSSQKISKPQKRPNFFNLDYVTAILMMCLQLSRFRGPRSDFLDGGREKTLGTRFQSDRIASAKTSTYFRHSDR